MFKRIGVLAAAAAWFATVGTTRLEAELVSQVMIDIMVGPAVTASNDLGIETDVSGRPVRGTYSNVEYKTAFAVGGRAGFWFNKYIGTGFDALRMSIETKEQTTDLVLTSPGHPTLTSRRSLKDGAGKFTTIMLAPTVFVRYPLGRFEPYLGVGPGIFFNNYQEPGIDANATNVGVTAPLGVRVKLMEDGNIGLALVSEARVTHNPADIRVDNNTKVDAKLTSLIIMVGASVSFDIGAEQ